MQTLTRDEFNLLLDFEQVNYINNLCQSRGCRKFLQYRRGKIIDLDSGEQVHDIYDYALDLHYEATDLQGLVFSD